MLLTNDPARIRQLFAAFFGELFQHEGLRTGFAEVGKVVEMRYHDPEIRFFLDLTGEEPTFVDATGGADRESDILVEMAWPVAHEFWKDDLDVVMAFISQRIKVHGATEALLRLKPHFKSASGLYTAHAAMLGIEGPAAVAAVPESQAVNET